MDIRRSVKKWSSGPVPPLAVGITLLAVLLRFYGLTKQPLWYDELIGMDMALYKDGLVQIWTASYYPHPPLFVALLHLVLKVFAPSEFSVRLLAAVGSVLAFPMFYRYVTDVANRRIALVGMLLLAFSPFYMYYSQESRPYSLIFAMVLVTIWVLYKALRSNKAGWWVAHALCILVLLYLHFVNWAIVGGEVLFMLVYWRRYRRSLLPFALSLLTAPLAIPPVFNLFRESQAAGQMHVLNAIPYSISFPETWKTLIAGETRYASAGLRLWGAMAFGLLAIVGGIHLWRTRRRLLVLILCMLAVPFVFVFVVLPALGQVVPPYEEKIFTMCLPFALILAASGIEALCLQPRRGVDRTVVTTAVTALGIVAILILVGSNVITLRQYYGSFVRNADMRVITFLESHVGSGELVVLDSLSMAVNTEFHWSGESTANFITRPRNSEGGWQFSSELLPWPALDEEGVEWNVTQDDVLAYPRVWLVSPSGHGNAELVDEMLALAPPVSTEQLGPYVVYLLEP